MRERKKLALLVVLAGVLVWLNLPEGSSSPTAAVLNVVRGSGQKDRAKQLSPHIPDARLQVERLDQAPRVQARDVRRNVFEYGRQAPPSSAQQTQSPPVAAPPPPPPRAPFRFYGVVESSRQGGRQVFLTDGEEIFVASEGAVVKKRYRLVRIQPQSIEVEELAGDRRWIVPLEQP